MNEKEVRELRRRFRADKGNFRNVFGCFVNDARKIISLFEQPLVGVASDEAERYLGLMKKTLSGSLDKNLYNLEFSAGQVLDSPEYQLLNGLLTSGLADEEQIKLFFQRIIDGLEIKGSYLILLARDVYPVPYRAKDGERLDDAADEEFMYLTCAVCPVKVTQPQLSYSSAENRFHSSAQGFIASAPALGFLFPAFDGRASNLYGALYYARNAAETHAELANALFHTELPMPAAAQKEQFEDILGVTLSDECSFDVLQSVHEELCNMIERHEESDAEEDLTVSKGELGGILKASGVSDEHIAAFEKQFDLTFGADAAIPPKNVVDRKSFEIRTPDATVKVNPERSDLVELSVIDNHKYILVRAEGGVTVNGVDANFTANKRQ